MGKIIIRDMQIRVRKESDKSKGWIRMDELIDTLVDSIEEEINRKYKIENLKPSDNISSKKDCKWFGKKSVCLNKDCNVEIQKKCKLYLPS